jgi:hypothetical protein
LTRGERGGKGERGERGEEKKKKMKGERKEERDIKYRGKQCYSYFVTPLRTSYFLSN